MSTKTVIGPGGVGRQIRLITSQRRAARQQAAGLLLLPGGRGRRYFPVPLEVAASEQPSPESFLLPPAGKPEGSKEGKREFESVNFATPRGPPSDLRTEDQVQRWCCVHCIPQHTAPSERIKTVQVGK